MDTKIIKILVIFTSVSVLSILYADEFSSQWYDGKAEISTYKISEKRYGEYRNGIRTMIFVTEPMRLSNNIKPDVDLPESKKIEVIKLNDIRRFNTGIYDYSVMTSVFAAVEKRKNIPLFGTMKVSLTSQEWCGNVFELLKRQNKLFKGQLFSYFEEEGETNYTIENKGRVEAEENLWVIIRELRGSVLKIGESINLHIIPSAWSRRKTHNPAKAEEGILIKVKSGKIETAIGSFRAVLFMWKFDGKQTEVWIESSYPHRILSWKEWDGSKGEIIASGREPYWKQKSNGYSYLREKLHL